MTSVVAYVCHEAGYFLGDHLGGQNYEDKDLLKILPPLELITRSPKNAPIKAHLKHLIKIHYYGIHWILKKRGLDSFIQARNAAHARWGFKIPHCGAYAKELCQDLRNPIFAVCVRNPIATCRSIAQREPNCSDTLRSFKKILKPMQTIETLRRLNEPFIAIDMDAVKQDPVQFLHDFAGLMQFDIPQQRLAAALAQPGYKRATPRIGVTYSAA